MFKFKRKYFKKIRLTSRKGSSQKNPLMWKVLIGIFVFFICAPVVIGSLWFYKNIYKQLPPIGKIEDISFSQTTTITDRNGKVLYKLFDENRYYVGLDKISKNMVNAIIATEDKNFWTNPGIDVAGMIRAGIEDVIHLQKKQGASTITQQLIKELLLSKEKTWTRKLKEIVLSVQLNSHIEGQIKSKYQNISSNDLDRKVKEKIIELYLNYIFLGNNSYGVEAASKTYFGTSAQNLDFLQSAILASIPKAPSRYNPYTNYSGVMWDIKVTGADESTGSVFTGELRRLVKSKLEENIKSSTFSFSKDVEDFLSNLGKIGKFDITFSGQNYNIQYIPGRKDIVLGRMYEMGYINQDELKKSLIEGLHFQFKEYRVNLDAPHFVFWVIEELKKDYGDDLLLKGGLTIKTSLDMDIQDIAKQSLKNNHDYVTKKGANNAAMVYLDSKSGDVLAYVGSYDYNDVTIDGQVDIIQSPRQPGSTMKPLLYTLGFMENNFTIDTPIYDLPYKVGKDTPENVDGQFNGLMSIKTALAGSRNIPAIKMYFTVGEDKPFKTFLKKLGIESLSMSTYYGYPLAIGAGELKIFELAKAYTHLSALGKPAKINPILEIRGPDNSIIYKKKTEYTPQVVPSGIAYMLWSILSNKENMPSSWVSTFDYPGLKVATKSGTTNVKLKSGKKLPRDGWLVTYTPSKVAIFWAGNTKGEPLNADAFGGWLSSVASKSFYKKLKDTGKIQDEDMESMEVKKLTVSKLSGRLITPDTPLGFVVNTIGYINNLPSVYDEDIKKVKVDKLCNGKSSDLTPESDIVEGYIINLSTIMPLKQDLESIKTWWKEKGEAKFSELLTKPILSEEPTKECEERKLDQAPGEISLEIMNPSEGSSITKDFNLWFKVSSSFNVSSVTIYIDDVKLDSFNYNKSSIIDIKNIKIPGNYFNGDYKLKIEAKDGRGNVDKEVVSIKLVETDVNPPYIMQENVKYAQLENGNYKVDLLFKDNESQLVGGKIIKDSKIINEFNGNYASFETASLDGITYEIKDKYNNVGKGDVILTP